MIDFIEGENGGEADGNESGDHSGDGRRVPGFEGAAEGNAVKALGDDGGGGAVAGELRLESFDGGSFYK